MNTPISFTKMSGAGNDFVVINNFRQTLEGDKARFAVALCSRASGIGADGLLLMEPSSKADFFMRYFNADGSYGGMCGNGGRCIARFAHLSGIVQAAMKFEALNYVYSATVSDSLVKLSMKKPNSLKMNLLIECSDTKLQGDFVDTGSPHFVSECVDVEAIDVTKLGRAIRNHATFSPEGCNANFVSLQADGTLSIRTFERGVEAETLACGTGSVASAIVFAARHGLKSPVTLNVRSGEKLVVYFDAENNQFTNVILEGSAHIIFSGTVLYDSINGRISDLSRLMHSSKS
ncbi:MAG: diaminopimelate epimerase [bacterium]